MREPMWRDTVNVPCGDDTIETDDLPDGRCHRLKADCAERSGS